jgi:hypothetical protein
MITCKTCHKQKPESEYVLIKCRNYRIKHCKACYYPAQNKRRAKPKRKKFNLKWRLYFLYGHNQYIVCTHMSYFAAITGVSENGLRYLVRDYLADKQRQTEGWQLLLFLRRKKVNRDDYKYIDASLY